MFLLATGVIAGVLGTVYLGVKIFAPWFQYDVQYIRKAFISNKMYEQNVKRGYFLADIFDETVKTYPDKAFIVFRERTFTFKDISKKANQVARAALEMGLQQGDTVALMMYNEPAFVWTYLGLQKLGIKQAFINYNLRSKSLAHCIKICQAKVLILGQGKDLEKVIQEIKEDLDDIRIYSQDLDPTNLPADFNSFEELMSSASNREIDRKFRSDVALLSTNVYIFTSGTTGLPKPAIVTQSKTLRAAGVMWMFMSRDDILYETLPMYHSAASMLGLGATLSLGATMVLREKFSASVFWDDCRKHNVTIIQYVGELCRYLVNTSPTPDENKHCVKYAFGNGLRKDVWGEFQRRFRIPNIMEFYAATENPVGFINTNNKFGSVGRSSPFLRKIVPCTFVKYDMENDEPFRNNAGFCVECKAGEVGLVVIPIKKGITFEGYQGHESATRKRLMYNVFQKGDKYVHGGDLLYVDNEYFVYFSDRVGDTFRWKGENVSTTEVATVIASLEFVHDANVYGVLVPGAEGRAGMAAICLKDKYRKCLLQTEINDLTRQCKELLPNYARPRFLRLQEEFEITSTFKQRKITLQKEGFDVNSVQDTLYYLDPETQSYVQLNRETYEQIIAGCMIL